ncbi:MAG: hypothetical protein JW839_19420 [Candidatus Lokiarchaeota archaeon]|nr:hypothetical protein [Candidatus Lokiarchaeota archaeon]
MPEFQLVKSREYPESIRQVAWSGDDKQALLSVVVEGGREIHILAPDGEQKHVLSGHAEPVVGHDWVNPETVASVSAEGEVRTWTIRGSRVDCTRIKDKYPSPRGILAIPSARKADARFLVWYQDARVSVFEAGKPAMASKALPGKVLLACALEGAILALHEDGGTVAMGSYDLSLAVKQSKPVALDDVPVQATGCKVGADACGCIVLVKGGKIVSCTTKDGKVHVLEKREEISALHVEMETRTMFLGTKSGMVHAVAFRPDLSFIDTIASFEAHEFKVTALSLNKTGLLLAVGGLDGVLRIVRIAERCTQKLKQPEAKPDVDWKGRERAEGKLRQADEAIGKGDVSRAAELIDAVKQAAIPGLEQRVGQAESRLRAKAGEQEQAQATRQRLIEFLDHAAEERGEILLVEVGKALSMPMADVKRWIKDLDAEMEWEYVEQQECLILFDRTMSITRKTDIERQMSMENDERYRRKGERRQLGRGRFVERQDRHPAQPRKPAMQRGRSWYQEPSPVDRIGESDVPVLRQVAAGISGKIQASILGQDLKPIKTVSLPDLISAMEALSQPARAIVTDGIISPRLAAIAEKAGVRYIVGQRLHPNLDKAAAKVVCIELHELECTSVPPPAAGGTQQSHDAERTSRKDLEGKLLSVISTMKWQSVDEILASAGIKDVFERNLAAIKLKQLSTSGTLVSEVVNKILYFKQPQQ